MKRFLPGFEPSTTPVADEAYRSASVGLRRGVVREALGNPTLSGIHRRRHHRWLARPVGSSVPGPSMIPNPNMPTLSGLGSTPSIGDSIASILSGQSSIQTSNVVDAGPSVVMAVVVGSIALVSAAALLSGRGRPRRRRRR